MLVEKGLIRKKTILMSTDKQPLQEYNCDFLITTKKFWNFNNLVEKVVKNLFSLFIHK